MKRRILYLLLLATAFLLLLQPIACHQLERWLGPKSVELQERHAKAGAGPEVDHSSLDAVLREFVTKNGKVRYQALQDKPAELDRYIAQLAELDFAPLSRNGKLALLINAYNAFTLRLILDHWPLQSIQDIPDKARWAAKRWRIGKLQLSLNELEHEYLRAQFKEPRIHFAINCASIGCPPLRPEAYQAGKLERQLQEQSLALHGDKAWLDLDVAAKTVRLTRLYLWFEGDFQQFSGSVLAFAARFHPGLAAELAADRTPGIDWIEYDWRLNQAR